MLDWIVKSWHFHEKGKQAYAHYLVRILDLYHLITLYTH